MISCNKIQLYILSFDSLLTFMLHHKSGKVEISWKKGKCLCPLWSQLFKEYLPKIMRLYYSSCISLCCFKNFHFNSFKDLTIWHLLIRHFINSEEDTITAIQHAVLYTLLVLLSSKGLFLELHRLKCTFNNLKVMKSLIFYQNPMNQMILLKKTLMIGIFLFIEPDGSIPEDNEVFSLDVSKEVFKKYLGSCFDCKPFKCW